MKSFYSSPKALVREAKRVLYRAPGNINITITKAEAVRLLATHVNTVRAYFEGDALILEREATK